MKTIFSGILITAVLFTIFLQKGYSQNNTSDNPDSGKLIIASCQFPISADVTENARWIRKQMKDAKKRNAHIVHFPECALSGYGGADIKNINDFNWEEIRLQTEQILTLAKELQVWVVLGTSHQLSDGNKPHNSLYVINPEGEIVDRYDKRFCTTGDLKYYTPGNHFAVFEVNNVKCGLLICYDIRFPELFREYRKRDVDIIFHSFYNARMSKDNILPEIMPVTAQASAASNYFYMSLTNSSAKYSWPCYFITPNGLVQDKLKSNKPGILISEIDTSDKFYDASRPFRNEAINGKLYSGEISKDVRSENRKSY